VWYSRLSSSAPLAVASRGDCLIVVQRLLTASGSPLEVERFVYRYCRK